MVNIEHLEEVESSLKNFFLREKARAFAGHGTYALMKYRGLSVSVKYEGTRKAVFIVGIAAYEAHFRISDGMKVQGSLGGDEQIVRKWYMYSGSKEILEKLANPGKSPNRKSSPDDDDMTE